MRIVVFGAEGLEGERLIEGLSELDYSLEKLAAVVDDPDADLALYKGRPVRVEDAEDLDAQHFDVAVFLRSRASSPELVNRFSDAGVQIIDASGYLAECEDVTLLGLTSEATVSEELPRQLAVADPVSAQLAGLLASVTALTRVDLSVQQPVSALGREGVETLAAETARLLNGLPIEASAFSTQLAFNCHAERMQAAEIEVNLQRLLSGQAGNNSLESPEVFCNVAVVPVFHSHLVSVALEFSAPPVMSALLESLQKNSLFRLRAGAEPGLTPVDQSEQEGIVFSSPQLHRRSPNRVELTLCADNLRKGVALIIIGIFKSLIKKIN